MQQTQIDCNAFLEYQNGFKRRTSSIGPYFTWKMSIHPNNNINIARANINVLTTYVLRLFIVVVIVNLIKTQKKWENGTKPVAFGDTTLLRLALIKLLLCSACNAYCVRRRYNKMWSTASANSKNSDQTARFRSLTWVFFVRMMRMSKTFAGFCPVDTWLTCNSHLSRGAPHLLSLVSGKLIFVGFFPLQDIGLSGVQLTFVLSDRKTRQA